MKKSILLGSVAFLFYGATAFGQGGNPGNGSTGTNYLGFDGTGVAQPLQIRNNFNQPIHFFTNNTPRMKLNGTTSYAVNSWNSARDGFLLLGSNTGTVYSTGAFSLLHLNGPSGAQDLGHRPWMETGITFTDNQDI